MAKKRKVQIVDLPVNKQAEEDEEEFTETKKPDLVQQAHEENKYLLEDMKVEMIGRLLVRRSQIVRDASKQMDALTAQIERVKTNSHLVLRPGDSEPTLEVDGTRDRDGCC